MVLKLGRGDDPAAVTVRDQHTGITRLEMRLVVEAARYPGGAGRRAIATQSLAQALPEGLLRFVVIAGVSSGQPRLEASPTGFDGQQRDGTDTLDALRVEIIELMEYNAGCVRADDYVVLLHS